jgi:hypothetical protein
MNNLFKCGEYNINMTIQHGFINTLSPYSTMSNRFSKRNNKKAKGACYAVTQQPQNHRAI